MTNANDDQRVQLEVWSDVACPWCYLGRRNLQIALDDIGAVERPEVTWRAFQLDPSLPVDGVDAAEYFAAKFPDTAVLDEARERLVAMGEEVGIQFRFDRQRRVANTHLAHRIIAAARAADLAEPVIDAFFRANFELGIDIGDADALETVLAATLGDSTVAKKLRAAAQDEPYLAQLVDQDIATARQLDITGVPTFVADRRIAVPGAVPPPILAQLLERAASDRLVAVDAGDD